MVDRSGNADVRMWDDAAVEEPVVVDGRWVAVEAGDSTRKVDRVSIVEGGQGFWFDWKNIGRKYARTDHIDLYPNNDVNHVLRAGNISGTSVSCIYGRHINLNFSYLLYLLHFKFINFQDT